MAVKRVIKGVHVVPMGFANAFLIEGDDGLTLIDAGFPRKEAVVFGAIRGLDRSPAQLKQLMFTHSHPDHIGSAAAIVRETGHSLKSEAASSLRQRLEDQTRLRRNCWTWLAGRDLRLLQLVVLVRPIVAAAVEIEVQCLWIHVGRDQVV
jgi:glyoxylase-like metal-dependent hydrolase (beta-lactamase superfamily II)